MVVRPEDLAATLVRRKRAERLEHARRAERIREALPGEVRAVMGEGCPARQFMSA